MRRIPTECNTCVSFRVSQEFKNGEQKTKWFAQIMKYSYDSDGKIVEREKEYRRPLYYCPECGKKLIDMGDEKNDS